MTKKYDNGQLFIHEWSNRKNDMNKFIDFIFALRKEGARMIGFNNEMFDYPIIHYIIINYASLTLQKLFEKVDAIIYAPKEERFNHVIWGRDRFVKQIDLLKINHFDNVAKFTSLKMLEFNMRSGNIQDLPYKPGVALFDNMIDPLIKYNINDVNETEKFFYKCIEEVELREKLSKKFGKDFTNHNDTKIGKDYFIKKLEEETPGICFQQTPEGRVPNQTIRTSIALRDVVQPV